MKKPKVRKMSIRVKILLPAVVVIVALCMVMGGSSYMQFKNAMIEMGIEEADMASAIAEKELTSDHIMENVEQIYESEVMEGNETKAEAQRKAEIIMTVCT